MDWISQWFERITQAVAWKSILSHAQWIDWLVLIALVIGLIHGIRKGFMLVLGDTLQLIAVIILTLEFDAKVTTFLSTYAVFLPQAWIELAGFLIAAVFFWWGVDFISQFLAKIITAQTSSQLKVIGGAMSGVVYAFLLLSFLSAGLLLSPLELMKPVYENNASYTGYKLAQTAPKIHQLVTHPIQASGLSSKKT